MSRSTIQTLRAARPADMPSVQSIINRFAADGEMLPRTLNELYENLRDFQVCEAEGKIIGCVALHMVWADLAEIKSLAVAKEAQGRSVGKDLVRAALDEAKRLGIARVFALTFRPTFFEQFGFRLIDKEQLPQKIWGECIRCAKFPHCNEQAVILD